MPLRDGLETDEACEILIAVILAQQLMVDPKFVQNVVGNLNAMTREKNAESLFRRRGFVTK